MKNSDSMQELRRCLGQFATGVTVVTCSDSKGAPCGITANSFNSVSLSPPLISWNIAKSSNSLQAYLDAEYFSVHMLTADQRELSAHFAKSIHTLFDGITYTQSVNGVPILPDCLARLDCSTHAVHDCGDHYIIVGHVDETRMENKDPLLFFAGSYRTLITPDT